MVFGQELIEATLMREMRRHPEPFKVDIKPRSPSSEVLVKHIVVEDDL